MCASGRSILTLSAAINASSASTTTWPDLPCTLKPTANCTYALPLRHFQDSTFAFVMQGCLSWHCLSWHLGRSPEPGYQSLGEPPDTPDRGAGPGASCPAHHRRRQLL